MDEGARQVSRRGLFHAVAGGALAVLAPGAEAQRRVDARATGWDAYKMLFIEATTTAVRLWCSSAQISGVYIASGLATGGTVSGTSLESLIAGQPKLLVEVPAAVRVAVARAVGAAWSEWIAGLQPQALPWYPAFAAYPGPVAPPTANVPTPIGSLVSPAESSLNPEQLAARIMRALQGVNEDPAAEKAMKDYANWLCASLTVWRLTGQVTGVIGSGTVPTFVLPFVPAGAVSGSAAGRAFAAAAVFGLPAAHPLEASGSFDQTVANLFRVRLENGSARLSTTDAFLYGTVTLTATNGTGIRLTLRSAGVALSVGEFRGSGDKRGSRPEPLLQGGKVQGGAVAAPVSPVPVRRQWRSLRAHGLLEVEAGPLRFSIPGACLELRPDGRLALVGGAAQILGLSHPVAPGATVSPSELKLGGSFALDGYGIKASTLTVNAAGAVSGSGALQAFGQSFALTYDFGSGSLRASAEVPGRETGWQSVPNAAGAQLRVTAPRVKVELAGARVTPLLRGGRLEVRTTAAKPDGTPWSQAAVDLGEYAIAANGDVVLRLPALPAPGDPLRTAREACEATARQTNKIPPVPDFLVGKAKEDAEKARQAALDALNAALQGCGRQHPAPPPTPAVPGQVTVKLSSLRG